MLAARTGKMPVLREEPQGRTTTRSTPGVGVFGLARLSTGQSLQLLTVSPRVAGVGVHLPTGGASWSWPPWDSLTMACFRFPTKRLRSEVT